jgi:basic amino acid/polyamine antiporter, APA family
MTDQNPATGALAPQPMLSNFDAVAMIIGVVVGIGIFTFPALVAMNAASPSDVILLWLAGGVISLVGALCYAELASAYPSAGGEYHFLTSAYGRDAGFIFAWARMTVIQTGAIALVAFILGDYASRIYSLGEYSSSIYAALAVTFLTAANVVGTWQGKWLQNLLAMTIITILLVAIAVGFTSGNGGVTAAPAGPQADMTTAVGTAMIFILLTYGGWNEAAYLSAEVKDARRNMVRVLVISILLITTVYVLVNLAYLRVLGIDGMRSASTTIGADLMEHEFGAIGGLVLSVTVVIAALSTANATIFTGARTNYALGRNFPPLAFLGRWSPRSAAPVNALLLQGAITLALVAIGAVTLAGVQAMVAYLTPVFWFFMLMTALSLFVLRYRNPGRELPFRVPLYPVTPILFALMCLYMLNSGIDYARGSYAGLASLAGIAIVLAGIPFLVWQRVRRVRPAEPAE